MARRIYPFCEWLFFTLLLLTGFGSGYGQKKSSAADTALQAIRTTYSDILLHDDFKGDTEGHYPSQWIIRDHFSTRPKNDYLANIKTWNGDKTLNIGWAGVYYISPVVNRQPLQLPDSFIIEFDFILESVTKKVDTVITTETTTKTRTDTLTPFPEDYWPHYSYGNTDPFKKPYVDTFRKKIARAIFSQGFNYSAWHRAVLFHKPKYTACYIITPKPFIAFTDTSFNFLQLSFGKYDRMLYRNISIKTAGQKNNFNTLLTDKKFTTRAIMFDIDKAVIRKESFSFLMSFAAWLKQHPEVKLEIAGHTDNEGSASHNMQLSQARSAAVKKYLTVAGIEPERLRPFGFGATQPIETNSTPEGRAYNRRVVFTMK